MSTLTITALENKTASVSGQVVVAEPCEVRLVGMSDQITVPNSLRIRFCVGNTEVARFPMEEGDVWVADGSDAVATVNTHTVQGLQVFSSISCNCSIRVSKQCAVWVEDIVSPKELFCFFITQLQNWPQVDGDDVPYNLDQWPDLVESLQDALVVLQNAYNAHEHSAESPTQVDHVNLLNAGTMTHSALEIDLAEKAGSIAEQTDNISDLNDLLSDLATLVGIHNHNAGSTQQLSHAGLSGIGTRTHAELEAADTSISAIVQALSDAYDAHKHTGADGTEQIALADVNGWSAMLARLEAVESSIISLTDTLSALDAEVVKKQTTLYSVTAPVLGAYRNITEDMTGDQLARSIPTIVQDLKEKGIL